VFGWQRPARLGSGLKKMPKKAYAISVVDGTTIEDKKEELGLWLLS